MEAGMIVAAARRPMPVNGIIFFGRKEACKENGLLLASTLTPGERSVLKHISEWLEYVQEAGSSTRMLGLAVDGCPKKPDAKRLMRKIEKTCRQLASGAFRNGLPKSDGWLSEVDMEISAMLERMYELKFQRKLSMSYMRAAIADSYRVYG